MPMLCGVSVLAALSALPFVVLLQPGYGQAGLWCPHSMGRVSARTGVGAAAAATLVMQEEWC